MGLCSIIYILYYTEKMAKREAIAKVSSKLRKEFSKDEKLKYMSPFEKNGIGPVLPQSLGNYLVTDNIKRNTIATGSSEPLVLLFCPSVRGCANTILMNGSTGVHVAGSYTQYSTLEKYITSDTPLVTRCLRAGLRIKNLTNGQSRGGVIRVLQISSPLNFAWVSPTVCDLTAAFANSLLDMARSHPRSRSYTAEELATGMNELVIAPATNAAYNSYGDEFFSNSYSCADMQDAFERSQRDMSFNNVILVFEPVNPGNSYEVINMTQDGMRFPANTLLNTLQKPSKVDASGRIQATHDAIQASGSELHDKLDEPKPMPKPVFTPYRPQKKKAQPKAKTTKWRPKPQEVTPM